MVNGVPVARYAVGERLGEHLFAANAQLSGFATQQELSDALGMSLRTVQRIEQRFVGGGVSALEWERKGGAPSRLCDTEETAIRKWHAQNLSGREMARRLKVAPGVVQNALRRLGLPARPRGGTPLALFPAEGDAGGRGSGEDSDADPEPAAPSPALPADIEREPSPTPSSASSLTPASTWIPGSACWTASWPSGGAPAARSGRGAWLRVWTHGLFTAALSRPPPQLTTNTPHHSQPTAARASCPAPVTGTGRRPPRCSPGWTRSRPPR